MSRIAVRGLTISECINKTSRTNIIETVSPHQLTLNNSLSNSSISAINKQPQFSITLTTFSPNPIYLHTFTLTLHHVSSSPRSHQHHLRLGLPL